MICWRSTIFSASTVALDRNNPISSDQINLQPSHIGWEHRPIRPPSPTDKIYDRDSVIVHALDADGGTAMTTKSLTSEKMEARVARFNKLQTYQRQNFETHGIPAGAVEKITARRVYPVMAPADYQGRSAGAPVKGPRGLIVSIAECEPGNGPGLHRHLNTVENFLCLSGRFEIAWGNQGEHTLVLEPLDMISVPRGENRSFRNVSNELGRLLVMIVPETDEQVDPISYAPSGQGNRERVRQDRVGRPTKNRFQVRR
jgi:quercetin dioxygenase-like cupin family protein